MSELRNSTREGRCRCGQIRLRISAPPLLIMACHCTGCQLMTSRAFSLNAAIPSPRFEIIKGEPVIGGLHGSSRHYFCPHCMSWLFTRPQGIDMFVNVRSTIMDDASRFLGGPFIETWTKEKLLWATTTAVHSFEMFPAFDQYKRLMKEYAEKAEKAGTW
jgi:hypothetical protein